MEIVTNGFRPIWTFPIGTHGSGCISSKGLALKEYFMFVVTEDVGTRGFVALEV